MMDDRVKALREGIFKVIRQVQWQAKTYPNNTMMPSAYVNELYSFLVSQRLGRAEELEPLTKCPFVLDSDIRIYQEGWLAGRKGAVKFVPLSDIMGIHRQEMPE